MCNQRAMAVTTFLFGTALILPGQAQILPADAKSPVQVTRAKGDFAKQLNGAVMPTGKGWKAASDHEKRVQIMVPDRWKVDDFPDGEQILKVVPPGQGSAPKTMLHVTLTAPRDADPLEVEEGFAATYADDLAGEPSLSRFQFRPTDAGFVSARGMKFALAGGTLTYRKKEVFQQQQLVYIAEDRIITVLFTAPEREFARYAPDVAKIFASYQNLGVRVGKDDSLGDTDDDERKKPEQPIKP